MLLASREKAVSLQRVEEMTGKKIVFKNVDICKREQLEEFFTEVSAILANVS